MPIAIHVFSMWSLPGKRALPNSRSASDSKNRQNCYTYSYAGDKAWSFRDCDEIRWWA